MLCRERGVEFTEIDLRWGITAEEAEQGKTIKTCLSEVDRCRPYFIGILGSRYGWQPTFADISKDAELLANYPFVEDAVGEGLSVTEMEMSYGALANPDVAPHAFFYFRKPIEGFHEEPVEKLRQRIRNSGFPVLEDFPDVRTLGAKVREDLLHVIETDFPHAAQPTALDLERRANEAYAHTRRRAYVPDMAYVDALTSYANDTSDGRLPLAVTGSSGSGKSSLVAYWTNDFRKRHPHIFLITHYVGASHSTPAELIRHLMLEIQERTGTDEPIPPNDKLEEELQSWLRKVPDEKIVIVIDAIDQLEDPRGSGFYWMPSSLPKNVHLIVSITDSAFDSYQTEESGVIKREWQRMPLEGLDDKRRREVIHHYLSQYHKTLNNTQLERIATDDKCSSPLFLRTLLEELRIFGKFEELDARIAHYLASKDTDDLFRRVLGRLENDHGRVLLRMVMSNIWAARFGLSEAELTGIITTASSDANRINRIELLQLIHSLDFHLIRKEGLLGFFHNYLRRAVETRYLFIPEEKKEAHKKLAAYFAMTSAGKRRADEEPFGWERAEDANGLAQCLTDVPLLRILLDEERRQEVIIYWKYLREHVDMKVLYRAVVQRFTDGEHTAEEEIELNKLLGDALTASSDYEVAEELLRKALSLTIRKYGEDSVETADAKTDMGTLLYHLSNYDEAEKVLQEAVEVKKVKLGEDNLSYAKTLNDLAVIYYARAKYDAAEQAYRAVLHIYNKQFAEAHSEKASTLTNLGAILFAKKEYVDAKTCFTNALMMLKKIYGKSHISVLACIRNLAVVEEQLGDTEMTELYYQEAITVSEKIYGKNSVEMCETLGNQGVFYSRTGRYEEALKIHYGAQVIRKKLLGDNHYVTIRGYLSIASTLLRLGKNEEGVQLFRIYLPMTRALVGDDNFVVLNYEALWKELQPDSFFEYKNAPVVEDTSGGN